MTQVSALPAKYFPTEARDSVYNLLIDEDTSVDIKIRQLEVILSDVKLSLEILETIPGQFKPM